MADAHRRAEAHLLGRPVSVADMQQAAVLLQQAYDAAGYVLVRVVLPPQTLADGGELALQVVEGFIEEIVVDNVAQALRTAVLARLQPLLQQRRLTESELERRVLVAGELPGLRLRSALVRGTQEGGTKLVLEGQATRFDLLTQWDNRLSDTLGRDQLGASLALNSPLGWGEQWYVAASYGVRQGSQQHATLRSLGAGVVLPLGTSGATLNPELTQAHTEPRSANGLLSTDGAFRRASLRLNYPLQRSRTSQWDLHWGFEHIAQTLRASDFNVDLSSDRYRAMRLGLEGSTLLTTQARLKLDGTLSAGLGGRNDADVQTTGLPTSSLGASPRFTKAVLGMALRQPVATAWTLDGQMRGQTTFGHAVFKPEQFALDGRDTLPAFAPGSLNADQGALLRLQVGRTLATGTPAFAALAYGFVAAARGHVFEATALETASIKAGAAGFGIRIERQAPPNAAVLTLTLEASTGRSNQPTQRRNNRVDMGASLRF